MKLRILINILAVLILSQNVISKSIDIFTFEQLDEKKLYFSVSSAIEQPENAFRLCQGGQGISEFDENLGLLHNLQYFNAAQNNLVEMPESFCKLKKLQEINFAGNNFKYFPNCIYNLKHLKHLDFSSNPNIDWNNVISKLTIIPELEVLDLSNDNITSFPTDVDFPALKELILSDNKISETEMKRIKNKLKNVIIYF